MELRKTERGYFSSYSLVLIKTRRYIDGNFNNAFTFACIHLAGTSSKVTYKKKTNIQTRKEDLMQEWHSVTRGHCQRMRVQPIWPVERDCEVVGGMEVLVINTL